MPIYDTIGGLFAGRRLDAGQSQQALAERAGVGVSTVSRLEGGGTMPRAANLAKLAMILGIAPEQLEAYGQDVAADMLRDSLTDSQQSMRKAFTTLVDAEIELTKLGFSVQLAMPEEGVLLLRCEQRSDTTDTDTATLTSRTALLTSVRRPYREPPPARRIGGDT